MKFIRYLIDIDLKHEDQKHLLINGNNGLADLISPEDYIYFKRWSQSKDLETAESENTVLYNKLLQRGYIVPPNYDEDTERAKICDTVKRRMSIKTSKYCRVHFLLTYACNFACPYCYEKEHRGAARLSFEQVDKIFSIYDDNIPEIGFFGGEPLLPGNMEIIKYIISKAPNSSYNIITNGYYLKDYIDILDKINVVFLQITLDGNKERHNQTRILVNGKGTYDTVLESIKLSLQRGLPTIVRMNVSPDNIDGCLETKQYIESQGWGKDNLWFDLQPIFQTTHSEHANLYSTLLDDDVESAKKNLNLKHLPPISNFLYNKVPLKPIIKACDADCFYRFYDPHGDIYSCIASVGDKRKRIGTYWPELTYEDKSFLTRDITTIPKCKSCKFALLCGGGCANAVNPDLDITETPNCYTMYNDINVTVPSVYRLMKERDERHA